ncbi:MAG: PfkB family carbohydrate kinase, partial [Oscillospiraceae bacterium]|nr:PfkB family carbohydrate kinase [Oscillospiraceae bacterium]
MIDILSMGEVLVDFTPYSGVKGEDVFKQNAGGAPANVAVQTALFGGKSAFIGEVGDDNFGKFLKDT